MEGLRLRGSDHATLVAELDQRTGRNCADDGISIIPDPPRWALPVWVGFLIVSVTFVGYAWAGIGPLEPDCGPDPRLCSVALLHIDTLEAVLPDAPLFGYLPPLDELDPGRRMTVGEVFELPLFGDRDPRTLISPEQLDRLLPPPD